MMATAKKAAPAAPAKKAVKAAPAKTAAKAAGAPMKPIKTAFNKTSLAAHLASASGVDPKATKAVMAALEDTILASVNKKGLGEFTLPGLVKIAVQSVPFRDADAGSWSTSSSRSRSGPRETASGWRE